MWYKVQGVEFMVSSYLFRLRGFAIQAIKVELCPTPFLFFLFSEKERTKEKPPEMPTEAFFYARYA
jgi:hypothetical protein